MMSQATTTLPRMTVPPAAKKRPTRARRRLNRLAWTWGSVLVGLAIWQFVGLVVVKNSLFLATPTASILAMGDMWRSGDLQKAFVVSGEEFIIGFAIAGVAGIRIG